MSVADPRCARCRRPMVFIGIAGAAEAFCRHCGDGPPCPKCRSTETEIFRVPTYSWTAYRPPANTRHCLPCGHVFVPEENKP